MTWTSPSDTLVKALVCSCMLCEVATQDDVVRILAAPDDHLVFLSLPQQGSTHMIQLTSKHVSQSS